MKLSNLLVFLAFTLCSSALAKQNGFIDESDLYRSPSLFSVKLSPDARYYSFVENKPNNYELKIHHIEENISLPLVFEKNEASKISEYQWLDNNTLHVTYSLSDGYEVQKLISLNFNESKFNVKIDSVRVAGEIIDAYSDKTNLVLYARKKQGRRRMEHVLYELTHEQLAKSDLGDIDEFEHQLDDASWYTSIGGKIIAFLIDDDEWEIRELNKSTGNWEYIYGNENADYDMDPVGRLHNGKLAVISDFETDVKSLYEFDVESNQFGKIIYQHPKYDLVGAEIDYKTQKIKAVHYYDHGRFVTEYVSEADEGLYRDIRNLFPQKQIAIVSDNETDYRIVFVDSSADNGTYYLYNNKTKNIKDIGVSQKELEKYNLSLTQTNIVKTKDGTELETFFTHPKLINNNVLLVMPHGGPINVRDTESFNHDVQYLASRGFSVLSVNFRGSSGYGKAFANSGVGQFGQLIEEDISLSVDKYLKEYNFKKVCAIGSSYGGYSSLMLAIKHPETYDCVISRFGAYDLPLIFSQSNLNRIPEIRKGWENILGEMRDELFDVSPLYLLEGLKAPILVTAGKKDEVTKIEHSYRLQHRLEELGHDAEYLFYNNSGHGHSRWFGDQHEMSGIYDFLKRKLNLENSSELATTADANSYAVFADGFDSEYYQDENVEKSFEYYLKAANLGHPRATFNIGSYYHRGEHVNYDIEKTVDYYEKAASLGFATASYRLGNMYFDAIEVEKDYNKSYELLNKARSQKHKYASLNLAKFDCLGIKVDKKISKCLDAFDLTIYEDETPHQFKKRKTYRTKVLKDVLLAADFDPVDLEQVKRHLTGSYEAKEFKPKVEINSYGLFDSLGHKETTELISIEKDQKFGAVLEIESGSEGITKQDKAIFLIKWTTPQLKDGNGVLLDRVQSGLWRRKIGNRASIMYTLNQDWELVEGEWKLEVFTIDKKPLFAKTFKTVKQ